MATGDGNGWVECRCGQRHWGRYGAAGLLLLRDDHIPHVLLQLRARWTHEGGSWGLVGGARDSHEDEAQAALREAAEEAGIEPATVRVLGVETGLDHVDWHYSYVLGLATADLQPRPRTAESDELRWVPVADVPSLPLHRGLGNAWDRLTGGIATALETARATGPW